MEGEGTKVEAKEEVVEEKPKPVRQVSVTQIQLFRDKNSVRYVALDSRARRVLTDETEDERFPTYTIAKKVLHARHPQAQIR